MIYHLHELHRAALAPWRFVAEANQQMLRHPFNPMSYTTVGRTAAAGMDVFEQATRQHRKPKFGIHHVTVDGKAYAVEEEIVARDNFCQLRHFRREAGDGPRVLVVAPLSGHFATLLRGTVQALVADHDVYITDWRDAGMAPVKDGTFDLDDYIDYVIGFLQFLGPDTHVLAVCQPSVPVLAAIAEMSADGDPATPSSMTLMGGPVDTRRSPTAPNRFAKSRSIEWFERTLIARVPVSYPGFTRRVYPGFLQLSGFMAMNLDRHVGAHIDHFFDLVRGDGDSGMAHRQFYEEYRAVMDLPAEYYLQTVKTVFQDHALPRGRMLHRQRKIEPQAIDNTALMTVEGELDDISGIGQTQAAHDLCTSLKSDHRCHYEQPGVGHYGVFNGSRWRTQIYPRVRDFIRANSTSG